MKYAITTLALTAVLFAAAGTAKVVTNEYLTSLVCGKNTVCDIKE